MSMSDSPLARVQCPTTVHLLSGSDIESFINAVSANDVDVPSIQGFRISSGNISQGTGDAFAGFAVKHIGILKIRHLEIHRAEEFLGSSHRPVYAFAACTTITHLSLDEVGCCSEEDNDSDDSDSDSDSDNPNDQRDPDYYARHNPIVLLRNSRQTLESLTGSGCKTLCTKANSKAIKDLSFKHVYPRLTSLSLLQCAEVPFAFRLVSAFPNLGTLPVSFALDAIMAASEAMGGFRVLGSTTPAHLCLNGFDADLFSPGFADALSNFPDDVLTKLEGLEVALDLGSTLHPDKIDVEESLTVAIRLSGHPTRRVATAIHEMVWNNAVPMVTVSFSWHPVLQLVCTVDIKV
ncbi:hypothetical protein V8D89_008554 [Ganoderma adspersum]